MAGMSVPRPLIDERAQASLDEIEQPVSIASAIRDRDGRLLDFRLLHVNLAAATWAGLERAQIIGRLVTDLIPALRTVGLFEALDRVVSTGQPFRQPATHYEGAVEDGRTFSAIFELRAVRLGDGYLSLWSEVPAEHAGDVAAVDSNLERARAAVPVVRLEASLAPGVQPHRLVPRPA
jgi:PAS fold